MDANVSQADILVVDDDPDIRQALQTRLKASGYDVHCAANGAGAITEARKQRPDLIVLDLGIPDDLISQVRGVHIIAFVY
jgi:DNA-binding response OmpR family regulator